jgi:predicted ATPase
MRTVADICLRLDGLPLAIELAAARAKVLSPRVLLERLEHRLLVLVGGQRDLPVRQQTLRATLAWSHDLLSPADQQLFRRLSVFAGGCTLSDAEALCKADADLEHPVLDGLSSLVDKNLLRRESGPDEEPRFIMLETIREFALEQLDACSETERLRERHARRFSALAQTAEAPLASGRRDPWLARLTADQENIRAALRWSIENECSEPGLAIVGALWVWFWLSFREGRAWAEAVFELPGAKATGIPYAKALFMASLMAWGEGDGPAFDQFGRDGAAVARAIGSPERLAYALPFLPQLCLVLGTAYRPTTPSASMRPIWRAHRGCSHG